MVRMFNEYLRQIDVTCRCRLAELFPAGVPKGILDRYNLEFDCMVATKSEDKVYEFMKLAEAARENKMFFGVCGVANDSLISFLVGNYDVDPLEAYYYCSDCGHYERISGYWYGAEAPDKRCPKCGKLLKGEGCSLDWRFTWGGKGYKGMHYEYIAQPEFMPYAKSCLESLYKDYNVVDLAEISSWFQVTEKNEEKINRGFAILPYGKTAEDFSFFKMQLSDGSVAHYVDFNAAEGNGETYILKIMFNWIDNPDRYFDKLLEKYDGKSLKDKAQYITSLDSVIGSSRGYKWLFSSREALYRMLIEQGNRAAIAFEFVDRVRRGHALTTNTICDERWEAAKEATEISNDILYTCGEVSYLASEGTAIALMNFQKYCGKEV